jgi:hypothetical protein
LGEFHQSFLKIRVIRPLAKFALRTITCFLSTTKKRYALKNVAAGFYPAATFAKGGDKKGILEVSMFRLRSYINALPFFPPFTNVIKWL